MSFVNNKTKPVEPGEQNMYVNNDNNSQGLYNTISVADVSPTPCPGSRNSLADSTVGNQNLAQLKEEMISEIKKEVYNPIMEMLGQVHNEIQMLKGRYETSKASSNVSCQTEWPSACNYSATSADNNNDRTIYDIPRPLKEWNASVPDSYVNFDHESKSSNSEQSQLVPISDTQMTHADDMENGAQPPVLPPRRNPYPHSAPACQEHDMSNIFRGNTVQLKPRPKSDIQPSRVFHIDKRELLANTVQFHIEDIVEGLAYQIDNLLDDLVVAGFLTREECASVKNVGDRKDHVRALLSLMKGKDLSILEGFVKHIARYNKEVARKITVKVGCSMQRDTQRSMCAVCKIEKHVNIKDIADSLWSVKVIDDNLFRQIIRPGLNPAEQNTHWKKVFHSFNSVTAQHFESAETKLLECLSKKDISFRKEIHDFLEQNQGKLVCTCEQRFGSHNIDQSPASVSASVLDSSDTRVVTLDNQGRKGNNNSFPTHKESEDIDKPTSPLTVLPSGHEKEKRTNISVKPPLLPKKPSPIRKPKDLPQGTAPTKCEDMRKVQSMPDTSFYDTPRVHSTKPSVKSKEHASTSEDHSQGLFTDGANNDPIEKHPTGISGIPPLPAKKIKHPPWKKADQPDISYV